MGNLVLNEVDFNELETERYWSFPKSYKGDAKHDTKMMVFSGDYLGARKMDGAYYRFTKSLDGEMKLQGRSRSVSGDFLNKIGHVPQLMSFFNALPPGTCLLGELYFPQKEGSHNVTTIMGCKEDKAIERQAKGSKLHYYVFDIWAWNGVSFLTKRAVDRFNYLMNRAYAYQSEYVEYAKYSSGEELWENLQTILANGGEGIVMTVRDSIPQPGKRTARKTLKVKKEISQNIDCFFTGKFTPPTREYTGKEIETWPYWEDGRTGKKLEVGSHYKEFREGAFIEPVTKPWYNGWVGSLEIGVLKDNKIFPIGFISGVSDEIKKNYKDYVMRPIEVTAMEFQHHEDGRQPGLRHAKFISFRDDLTLQDCTYNKIFGNVD